MVYRREAERHSQLSALQSKHGRNHEGFSGHDPRQRGAAGSREGKGLIWKNRAEGSRPRRCVRNRYARDERGGRNPAGYAGAGEYSLYLSRCRSQRAGYGQNSDETVLPRRKSAGAAQ